ncbi:guanine nucleotide-binding protein G(I)/G(S)/G(O) subunit gamma-T2 [Phocoena sinus]|uniref:guanine nucleotide-binding protein G(I)/G(S)/G(O) subunit gamma-T2 n=1 Tax=Phocoena sinus TaxID=42100 RepID=UPI0013C41C23|nr:guanine nucleotide-binding protein G(I)/G(S)/G(O) subunit gamma-T2 [Phocoena sinus]XP_032472832.1 guanine nucleotide-binding protein G(I)/G(S)/G(O) subunit gamma-T2 [Phocoena sinus]XP_032472833.1 guanine nucleotide-binding protein G(I)/G(S)/G(O) subunit gamma-T2 [Phocoena sinus]XP_032472834.1 guanine nucleotide-binding protein G(I)/G(S)/G(O) subunit gamma-T2 [Phocoena sinus]
MAQELSEKELLKMEVEQLKKEVKNPRAPISKTGKEIKDYVEAEAGNDPLLKGIPEDKNPFKEKGGLYDKLIGTGAPHPECLPLLSPPPIRIKYPGTPGEPVDVHLLLVTE